MGRTMVYPYTLGAMIKAFPLKYHVDKSWIFKSYALGLLLTAPIFYKITTVFPAEADVWNPFPQRPAKSDH